MNSQITDARRALVRAVQSNCNIADARHAADLSLCIYLLQMREFYRWEQGLGFNAPLDRDAIGQWLAQREALWGELEARPFEALPFGGDHFDQPQTARLLDGKVVNARGPETGRGGRTFHPGKLEHDELHQHRLGNSDRWPGCQCH